MTGIILTRGYYCQRFPQTNLMTFFYPLASYIIRGRAGIFGVTFLLVKKRENLHKFYSIYCGLGKPAFIIKIVSGRDFIPAEFFGHVL